MAIEISAALPRRISVYEEGGRTIFATIKPTVLLATLHARGRRLEFQEIEDAMIRLMNEAARGIVSINPQGFRSEPRTTGTATGTDEAIKKLPRFLAGEFCKTNL